MRPRAQFSDIERSAIDAVAGLLAGEDCTVGMLPDGWRSPDSTDLPTTPHVQVALDGTTNIAQVVAFATIRVTAWALDPTEAKRLALLAEGLVMELPYVRSLTGMQPGRDPQNRAEIASLTVRWAARSVPIP